MFLHYLYVLHSSCHLSVVCLFVCLVACTSIVCTVSYPFRYDTIVLRYERKRTTYSRTDNSDPHQLKLRVYVASV
jgi:hypothetical protein